MGQHCSVPASNKSFGPSDRELFRRMEREREEGQSLLQIMALSDDVNWEDVIQKAKAIQKQEELLLNRRSQKHALELRKRYDAIGSFSVNLLTYRVPTSTVDDEDDEMLKSWATLSATSSTSHEDEDEDDDYVHFDGISLSEASM